MHSLSKLEFNVSESSVYDKLRKDYSFKVIFMFLKKMCLRNEGRYTFDAEFSSIQLL